MTLHKSFHSMNHWSIERINALFSYVHFFHSQRAAIHPNSRMWTFQTFFLAWQVDPMSWCFGTYPLRGALEIVITYFSLSRIIQGLNFPNDFDKTMRCIMGGSASGTWYRWDSKDTTESQHRVDIRWLKQKGYLMPGNAGKFTWSCNGEQTGAVGFRLEPDWGHNEFAMYSSTSSFSLMSSRVFWMSSTAVWKSFFSRSI